MKRIAAVVLAAGKGVRMKSDLPKALYGLSGRALVEYPIEIAKRCGINKIAVVGGYRIGLLKERLSRQRLKIIEQKRLLGSADAVKRTENYFKRFKGTILILYADTPLIKTDTIKSMLKVHQASRASVTLLTGAPRNPKDYGRILRDANGKICSIIERPDLERLEAEGGIAAADKSEVNVGAYSFDAKALFEGLRRIRINRLKGEFYLTDIISYFYKKGYTIRSYTTTDADEMQGVNTREELSFAEEVLRKRTIQALITSGVTVKDPANTYISEGARIGAGTVIYPFVVIDGGVRIGRDCRVGPFAHIRQGTVLKNGSEIGNFVEVVRSEMGSGSKAKHHTYLGDATVGRNVNVGAGTITANYDGKNKHRTVIEDGAFIGSGTTIVAPVKIGKSAITGAGSVVLKGKNVPPRAIVVGVPARPLTRRKR